MGRVNAEVYEDLKERHPSEDFAVAGEAPGKCADEMLVYTRKSQHEKMIREMAVGLALLYHGRQKEADVMVKELLADKVRRDLHLSLRSSPCVLVICVQDPILRYGGVHTSALAYAGTSNDKAIRKILHIAVSDTSDDGLRAGVTSLTFLLFESPSRVCSLPYTHPTGPFQADGGHVRG
jgi:26S proteasome regulatory subunit N2